MEEHAKTELEVEDLRADQNGRIRGSWLCCIPCYWLRRNNRVHKSLLTLATLLVTTLLVASPVIFLISNVPGDRSKDCVHQDCYDESKKECQLRQCEEAGKRIAGALLWSQDPCHDFYQFACGGFEKDQTSDYSSNMQGSFVDLQSSVSKNIQQLLAVAANSEPFQKLGAFYKSCQTAGDARISFTPMTALLNELGGYLPPNAAGPRDLTVLILRLLRINGAPLFQVKLGQDVKNGSRYAPYIDLPRDFVFEDRISRHQAQESTVSLLNFVMEQQGDLNMKTDKEYAFLKAAVEERRLLLMEKILLELLPENMTGEQKAKEIQNTLLFTSTLSKLYPLKRPKVSDLDMRNMAVTILELEKNYPYIQWKLLLEQLLNSEFYSHDIVYVLCPLYLKSLEKILPHFQPRVVHNGLLVVYAADTLYELVNVTVHLDWPLFCTRISMNLFKEAVSALYVRQFQPQQIDQMRLRMIAMLEALKLTLTSRIKAISWIDAASREAMLKKLTHLRGEYLSWPHFWNNTYINELLEDVRVDPVNFFGNVIRRYSQLSAVPAGIKNERPDLERKQHPFVVNAFYLPTTNTMMIPLVVLVQSNFNEALPRYIPYATVGQILAHEMLHAFDLVGGNFNHMGEPASLLTVETSQKLATKLDCVQRQFSGSFSKNVNFFGKPVAVEFDWNSTLNENMADISGLEVSFQTWATLVGNSKEYTLPGLRFTSEQLFFINAAQMYCSKLTPEMYIILVQKDSHAPYPERVNGMMMNSPSFASAFRCRVGSYMNPKRKCTIW